MPNTDEQKTVTLSAYELGLITLALQGLAMRQGPLVWDKVVAIVDKLGTLEMFEGNLIDWVEFAKPHPPEIAPNETAA